MKNLTKMNKFAILILVTRGAAFLCIIIGLSLGAKSVTASLVTTERSPFFIGDIMPSGVYARTPEMGTGKYIRTKKICSIEGCNDKYYGKGLCQKHWSKQYQQKHKEHIVEVNKQWYQDNKEHRAKYRKQQYQDNKEKELEQSKLWQRANRQEQPKKWKQYRQTPAGKASSKAHWHNRRTLLKGLTKAIIQKVYEVNIVKYGQLTCVLCFKPIINGDDSLEHSTPLTRSGTNKYENLGIAHYICNCKKGIMTLNEWFK